jgi:cell division protein FtsA
VLSDLDFFASVDVGSSKIAVLIANIEDNKFHVIGHASGPSSGVKNGAIVNVEGAAKAIQNVIDKVNKNCKHKPKFIDINVTDLHLSSRNQNRPISFNGRTKIITQEDTLQAIQNSSAGALASNKKNLDPIVNHFTVDEQIENSPIGMEAAVLGAEVHLISVSNQAINNISHSLRASDLGVDKIILDPIASSMVCVSQDDKNTGVCLLDIGAGTSKLSVFVKGGVVFNQVFDIGGNTITQCIAQAYDTSFDDAEELKKTYGTLQTDSTIKDRLIKFKKIGSTEDHYLSLHELILVIEKPYKEICTMVKRSLKKEKLDRAIKSGFILLGGACKIKYCENFLLKEFRARSRMAKINEDLVSGDMKILNNLSYFSALGLLACNTPKSYLQEPEQLQKSGLFGTMQELFKL